MQFGAHDYPGENFYITFPAKGLVGVAKLRRLTMVNNGRRERTMSLQKLRESWRLFARRDLRYSE